MSCTSEETEISIDVSNIDLEAEHLVEENHLLLMKSPRPSVAPQDETEEENEADELLKN